MATDGKDIRIDLRLTGEPAIEDLLADELTHLIMRRDRVQLADLRALLDRQREALGQANGKA